VKHPLILVSENRQIWQNVIKNRSRWFAPDGVSITRLRLQVFADTSET